MSWLGQLVIWGSLAAGALAAATGYVVSLDLPDEQLLELTLAADAGKVAPEAESPKPIVEKDQTVTAELLQTLRQADVKNLRVKEFSFRRWRGKWYFLLALGGLAIGAYLTRRSSRPAKEDQLDAQKADSPEQIFDAIQNEVAQLRADLPEMPSTENRLEAIVDRLGELQKTRITDFVEARTELVSTLGLAGYATLMDFFAATERQINRAWSAAADEVYHEAITCIEQADLLLQQTREKLPAAGNDTPDT